MFRILDHSAPPRRPTAPRFVQPQLEELESRWVPSTVTLNPLSYGIGRQVTVSGTVTDCFNPAFKLINISGQACGMTMTNSQGQFSVTVQANSLGYITATEWSDPSSAASALLTDVTPVISEFTACEHPGNMWILEGTVSYSRGAQLMVVNFGGVPVSLRYQTTMTNTSGHFELSVLLNGTISDNGSVWAQTISPWGTRSDFKWDHITQTGV